MAFSHVWNGLVQLDNAIDALGKDIDVVNKKVLDKIAQGKRSLYFQTKEFQFEEDDLTFKTSPLIQNSEGLILIDRLTYEVYFFNDDLNIPRQSLLHTPQGFVLEKPGVGFVGVVFDFEYNVRLGASDTAYGQDTRAGITFLSRESLGYPVSMNVLNFKRPFILKENEFFELSIKPIRYILPGDPDKLDTNRYIVSMNAIGYKIVGEHVW